MESLVGALVGGVLSLVGSLLATRKAADSANKLAATERQRHAEQERRSTVSAVLAEIQAILRVAEKPETMTRNTLVPFSMDVWTSSKGAIGFVDPEIERLSQEAYAELALANALAAQNVHLPYGRGDLNDPYRKHVKDMIRNFQQAIPGIERWLDLGRP